MNPLQRAATIRKASYLGAIVALFTLSMFWRGLIAVPGASAAAPMRWLNDHSIDSQATKLEVSDVDKTESEADLSGSAVRLALTGSRGLAVTVLWYSAIDRQKRNDFHVFEQRVRAVTKLQPNFVTPWIFQSWNITYNVSVEMQGSGDMYYYIVRGIQLLAEGERRNQRSPDMRYQIAFYYQNKFGVADTVEVLRCLYDLSCMPPSERNPDRYFTNGQLDLDKFQQFCAKHPHFVRRLRGDDIANPDRLQREKLRAPTPEDVVRFLRDNYRELPSRYRKNGAEWTDELLDPYTPPDQYFPVLPRKFDKGAEEANPETPTATDDAETVGYFSAFKAARGWYAYSQLLLPPPMHDDNGQAIPAPTQRPGEFGYDPFQHRVPRSPMTILFRQGAPRAQTYAAELEHKEGWFDNSGWAIEGWFPKPVTVGTTRSWGLKEWEAAAAMWRKHGRDTGLQIDDARLAQLLADGGNYDPQVEPTEDQLTDAAARRRYFGTLTKGFYGSYRQTTNFPFFLASAETEQLPETTAARKLLFAAELARKAGKPEEAIPLYKQGLDLWRGVFERRPDFQRLDRSEEEACELELAYQRLLVGSGFSDPKYQLAEEANKLAHGLNGLVPFVTPPFPPAPPPGVTLPPDPLWPTANLEELKWFVVENVGRKPFSSPFVGTTNSKGEPLVRQMTRDAVRMRQGITRGQKPAEGPPPGAPPAPPAPTPAGRP